MTPEKITVAKVMYVSGEHDITTIARVVNVSRATVYRVLAIEGRPGPSHRVTLPVTSPRISLPASWWLIPSSGERATRATGAFN